MLGRACNRLKERAEFTTADINILLREWLLVDLDPVRPPAFLHLKRSTKKRPDVPNKSLPITKGNGGCPIIGDSGNGAHLLYRLALPNDKESLHYVTAALAELDRRYSDDAVKVDTTSHNAARVWKCYGTVARKGDSLPDRPHRVSRIIKVPE